MPWWLRAALAVQRVVASLARWIDMLIGEAAVARVPPSRRDLVTTAIYDRHMAYAPGGGQFRRGLHDWEEAAIAQAPFPPRGRLLVGGAGGGREAIALAERGYEVLAFDPSPRLIGQARAAVPPGSTCRFVLASYTDLVDAVERRTGPLADALTGFDPDATVIGWGSFAHLWNVEHRAALFRAIRALAPAAPLLVSWHGAMPPPSRVQRALRGRVFRRAATDDAVVFNVHAGYLAGMSEEDLRRLAAATGYRIHVAHALPTPHALLVPAEGPGSADMPAAVVR